MMEKDKKKINISLIIAILEGILLMLILLGIGVVFIYKTIEQNKYLGVWEYIKNEENNESISKTKIQMKIEKNNKVTIYIASYYNGKWVSEETEGKYSIANGWLSVEVHDEENDFDYIWVNFPIKDKKICYSYDCEDEFEKTKLKDIEKEKVEESNSEEENITNSSYDLSNLNEIKGSTIKSLSNNDTLVILIGRETCGWCVKFAPVFENVTKKYEVKSYYVDIAKILDFTSTSFQILDEESYNTIISLKGEGQWENFAADNFGATPQVLIIKNNQVIGGYSGYTGEENFAQVLEQAGIKKN